MQSNEEYGLAADYETSLLEGAAYGVGAVAVDIGQTIWNSIAPEAYESTTYDTLSAINSDMASFYTENRNAVEFMSFVGGMIIPGLGVAKAAKAASTGAGLFGTIGKVSSLGWSGNKINAHMQTAAKLASEGKAFTTAYNTAMTKQRLWTLENSVAENVLFESSFLALMNDHAYIEESYGLDTFLIGTALGSAITTPISIALNGRKVKDLAATLQLRNLTQYGATEGFAVNTKAIAGAYDPGSALYASWFATDDLTSKFSAIPKDDVTGSYKLMQNAVKEQELTSRNIAVSMLDYAATNTSEKFRAAKAEGAEITPWWELRSSFSTGMAPTIGSSSSHTPLQIIGAYTRKNPGALEGVQVGKTGHLERAPVLGTVPDKITGKMDEIIDDGFLIDKAYTYNEAITSLSKKGGDDFKEAQDYVYLYEWDGQVQKVSPVEGRLLQGASDYGYTRDKSYPISAKRTYNPAERSILDTEAEMLDAAYSIGGKLSLSESVDSLDIPRLQAAVSNGLALNTRKLTTLPNGSKKEIVSTNSLQDTQLALRQAKMEWIGLMHSTGFDIKHIAKATNTPTATVDGVIAIAGDQSKMQAMQKAKDVDWIVFKDSSPEGIDRILGNKMLKVGGNFTPDQNKIVSKGIAHDRNYADTLTKIAVEQVVATAKPALFRKLWDMGGGKSTNAQMEQNLHQLLANAATGSMFTSTDMALRYWEKLNGTITTMGDDFSTLVNEHGIKPIVGGLQTLANGVAKEGKGAIVNLEQLRAGLDALPSSSGKASQMRFDGLTNKVELKPAKGNIPAEYLKIPGTNQDWVSEYKSVGSFVEGGIVPVSQQLWDMRTVNAKLSNVELPNQRGVHIPYDDISDDFVAYVVDMENAADVQRISGTNLADLEDRIAAIRPTLANTSKEIVDRKSLDTWNQVNDYAGLEYLSEADPMAHKGGVASKEITGSPDVLERILKSYEGDIIKQSRMFQRLSNSGVFDKLGQISHYHDSLAQSSNRTSWQKMQAPKNPAKLASNTLLNISKLDDAPYMKAFNNATDITINFAANTVARSWAGVKDKAHKGEPLHISDFNAISQELANKNIPNPWKDIQDYVQSTLPKDKKQSPELVAATSQVMTLFNLRLLDVSHAIVTTLSTPALILGEGTTVTGKLPMRHFMNIGRKFFSRNKDPELKAILDRGKELGYTARRSSEATTVLNKAMVGNNPLKWAADVDGQTMKELLGAPDKSYGKIAYKAATKPSDWAEEVTREYAYLTGYKISQDTHKGAAAAVHEEAANLFTKRAMGNYSARQRPVMFQGSFGQAIGLYQTFMMTIGQNFLRMAEKGNVTAAAAFTVPYSVGFGINSLPLYSDINQMVGTWLSGPDHQDITSTVYEAFGNKYKGHERSVGEFLLYGAPSALFQSAWYTRGDLDPRVPIESGRIQPAIITAMGDLYASMSTAAANSYKLATSDAPVMDVGRALLEGVASQSMWRPASRLAELGLNYSVDQKGEIMSTPAEMKGIYPTLARLTGARPLKESVLRSQRFFDRAYDTVDTQKRRKVTHALRTHLRGNGNSGVIANMMQDYMRDGGTPEGWGSVLNKTYLGTNQPLANKLLDQVNKQPGITAIIDGYAL